MEVDENGDPTEDNMTFVTPPPKRCRVLQDTTNTNSPVAANSPTTPDNNNGTAISEALKALAEGLKKNPTTRYLMSELPSILELAYETPEDINSKLKFIMDEIAEWEPPEEEVKLPFEAAKKDVTPVPYNPDIFKFKKDDPTSPVSCDNTAYCNKYQCTKRLKAALDFCGSEQHQLLLIHQVLTSEGREGIGMGLGLLKNPVEDTDIIKQTATSINEMLHSGLVLGSSTNDAIGFQKTGFVLIAPTAPADDASNESWQHHKKLIDGCASYHGITGSAKKRLKEAAIVRRDILAAVEDRPPLLQTHRRKIRSDKIVTDENKEIVRNWCLNHNQLVSTSPFQRDSRFVKDENGKKVMDGDTALREPVYLYKKSRSRLYEHFKKPVNQGGCYLARNEEGQVVIGPTTFNKLLPTNLHKMTKTHKIICDCREHQNMEFKHEALLYNRRERKKHFDVLINTDFNVADHPIENARMIQNRDAFLAQAYTP
ncbi:MAG: hypothetical protein ACRCZI_14225, partial [Cetobacterium sp.]